MLPRIFDENGLKECRDCKIGKTKEEYYPSKSYSCGFRAECRDCGKKKAKQHPKTPKQNRIAKLKKFYNLTLEEYDEMFKKQGGVCAICKGTQATKHTGVGGINMYLDIDHDHETGEVRGLLCGSCNRGLGQFKDNIENVLNAAIYLEKYRLTKQ